MSPTAPHLKKVANHREILANAAKELTALTRDVRHFRASQGEDMKAEDIRVIEEKLAALEAKSPKLRGKTAGEVRFIKDKGNSNEWAWDQGRHSNVRTIPQGYEFNPDNAKILVRLLRSTIMALGHSMSAYTQLAKARSCEFSPDGMLGGVGYVKKISGIRQEYNNIIEALSSMMDTFHDEINAPHWTQALQSDSDVQEEVEEMMDSVEEMKASPQDFAQQQEMEQEQEVLTKLASTERMLSLEVKLAAAEQDLARIVRRYQ